MGGILMIWYANRLVECSLRPETPHGVLAAETYANPSAQRFLGLVQTGERSYGDYSNLCRLAKLLEGHMACDLLSGPKWAG